MCIMQLFIKQRGKQKMTNLTTYTKETMPKYLTKIVNTALTPFLENTSESEIKNLKLYVDLDNFKTTPIIGILTFNAELFTIHVKLLRKTDNLKESLETVDYSKIAEVKHTLDYEEMINHTLKFTIILECKND